MIFNMFFRSPKMDSYTELEKEMLQASHIFFILKF